VWEVLVNYGTFGLGTNVYLLVAGLQFIPVVIFTVTQEDSHSMLHCISGDFPKDPFSPFQQATSLGAPGWSREFQEAGMFSSPARTLISEEVLEALRTSDFLWFPTTHIYGHT
uniref:Uncharacterized protein n=1 Tax=Oncorhynchus tshawytscha TaxID=74940 RepID=A0A8C8JBZ1_ONCTS